MKYQVLSTDEYGQTSILNTSQSIESAMLFMKKHITGINFENALTTDDKMKSFEAFSVDFFDENDNIRTDIYYSGNTSDGRPRVITGSNDSYKTEVLSTQKENSKYAFFVNGEKVNIKIYIGSIESKVYYLVDDNRKNRGNHVDDINHSLLEGKIELFIRVI